MSMGMMGPGGPPGPGGPSGPPGDSGGVDICPACGGRGVVPRMDGVMGALSPQSAGVQASGPGNAVASMTDQQVAQLLEMLQQTGAGQPAPMVRR
jgi:hypothetical protein